MTIYDTVKDLLIRHPELRSSDKKLIWRFWEKEGALNQGALDFKNFRRVTTPGTITRARRKVQENYSNLQAVEDVKEEREKKAQEKGTHIFNNQKLF